MTVIQKLSDRDGLIFECIKMILVNKGNLNAKEIQWELFQAGVYARGNILKQALSVMKEKEELKNVQPIQKEEADS